MTFALYQCLKQRNLELLKHTHRLPKTRDVLLAIVVFSQSGWQLILKRTRTSILRCIGYWSSIKDQFKERFSANSSSCTTTEITKLLSYYFSCLTVVKKLACMSCMFVLVNVLIVAVLVNFWERNRRFGFLLVLCAWGSSFFPAGVLDASCWVIASNPDHCLPSICN